MPSSPAPSPRDDSHQPVLKRLLLRFARPRLGTFLVALFWMALNGAVSVAVAWAAKPLVDGFRDGTYTVSADHLIILVLAIPTVFVIRSVTAFLGRYVLSHASNGVINDVRKATYAHIASMDMAFLQSQPAGTLTTRVTADTDVLGTLFMTTMSSIGRDIPTLIGLVAYTLWLDWKLSLIAYVLMPLAIWPITLVGRKVRRVSKQAQAQAADLGGRLIQTIRSVRIARLYGAERQERIRVHGLINRLRQLQFRIQKTRTLLAPLTEAVVGLALGGVVLYGGLRILDGSMTEGAVVSFLVAVMLAYRPAKSLANLHVDLQGILASVERVFEVLDTKPTLQEAPDARDLPPGPSHIRLETVTFAYPGAGRNALADLSLDLEPGRTVALVGPSGAGKSSVLNMITRLYDPTAGMVSIDGNDLRSLRLASLWERISLVSQEVIVFDDTARANIAYGAPGVSSEAIEHAARMAGADAFIRDLPQGYDTWLGERGASLSGGQRQRLSIARAFLKDAPVLLLDEPTSALDGESERLVQAALEVLMRDRATLVIAHRLSTIRAADIIHVMDRGRIVESGTHDSLAHSGGLYARLLAAGELGS
ncbi:ABC transporter ATP-binding protein [Phaeovibrio sulfidiphilus]|uniref:ABC transporter ATP-binding protein n=1 Tax=Phaeovibrio sulfidiphilus TaxID=1220600 RepID=A0A8J7CD51_9PROT|nr:ABC transporter ATP-binding protein [Phaeovibrio sulfidiphilus]MBE1236709.1 ABC transporter ATP-binding protein [Phaeovibrio sulfidiphilus]